MNFSSKKDDKSILFSISKSKEQEEYFVGWFLYSSNKGQYLCTSIYEKDEWVLIKKLLFSANREIPKCYFENIEELTTEIWNKFFNSKQAELMFANKQTEDSLPHHIFG